MKSAEIKITTALLLCLLLGACATGRLRAGADNPATVASAINLSGFPPEYKRGFAAGCADQRNGVRGRHPKGNASFVQGWRDGADYCRSRPPR